MLRRDSNPENLSNTKQVCQIRSRTTKHPATRISEDGLNNED